MSTRCDGVARRSFIIGMRLWPPATTRAPLPRSLSAAMAPSTLVARSYSKAAGVCTALLSESGRTPAAGGRRPRLLGHALARLADVVALLVLHRAVAANGRRSGQVLGPVRAPLGVERRAWRLPRWMSRSAGPAGLPSAIGASRPSRARVSVPRV